MELQHIRCFSHLVIDFDEPKCCALFVGDNGDGKSTVLRSLAMGLCDQSSASALFRELPGEFVRRDSSNIESFVQIDLKNAGGWRYRIRTRFVPLAAFERIEQTHFRAKGKGQFHRIDQDEFPWADMFVSGYGPGIRTFGNADYSYYLPVDAVYSLFRYDAALQSPELVIRRLVDEAGQKDIKRGNKTLDKLTASLALLLKLNSSEDIELTRRGIFVTGPWGREELASLGDGYRATTTWVLDLMSWWLLYYEEEPAHEFDASDLAGIVIVDELEQHLHPRWQRTILSQLRQLFPDIQFIVATHSPLVASSCPDITVHRLQNGEHAPFSPYGWRAEDVYDMMGLDSSRAVQYMRDVIEEFSRLDRKRLKGEASPDDLRALKTLHDQLRRLPEGDPVHVIEEIKNIRKELES
jgi:predicted ATPase